MILALLLSCTTDKDDFCAISIEQPIPNAAIIRWSTEESEQPTFSWTDDSGTEQSKQAEQAGTNHEFTITAMLADSPITYQFEKGGQNCSGEFETDPLPSYAPSFDVTTYHPELMSSEPYFLGVFIVFGFGFTASLIDREGQIRWMFRSEGRISAMIEDNIHEEGVLLNSYPMNLADDDGKIIKINMMGEIIENISTPLGHHAFMQLKDGTIAWPAFDIRDWEDPETGEIVQVSGDKIVEHSPDGEQIDIFNSWDWLEVTKHEYWENAAMHQGSHDWTHANTLIYNETSDNYTMSFPYIQTIVEVNRSTGNLIQEISPSTDSFPEQPFIFQHWSHWLADEHLLLISHEEEGTAAIEYELMDGKLTEVWTHGRGEQINGQVLGQVTRLSNGNTLVNYGGAGLIQEVTPDNVVVWELSTILGTWAGSGQLLSTLPQ